jgi:hypothetical protein
VGKAKIYTQHRTLSLSLSPSTSQDPNF